MKNILVLHSYHQGLEWTDSVTQGIESVFHSQKDTIELHYEYLDTKRNVNKETVETLASIFKSKYSEHPFEVIIASDNNSLKFIQQYGKSLFPGASVVFCGINNFRDELTDGIDRITGVVEATDFRETIELMLTLHPHADKILIILDSTDTGIEIRQDLLTLEQTFKNRIDFEIYHEFVLDDIRNRISGAGPENPILLLTLNRDSDNTFISSTQAIKMLSRISKAPIYSTWDFYFGKGITGGIITSGYDQGSQAAMLAMAILSGKTTDELPIIMDSPNRCMFDYQQMKHFGIRASQLPGDCTVINKPPTFYEKYHRYFIIITLVTMVSFVVLAWNLNKQKRSKRQLIRLNADLDALVKEKTAELVKSNRKLNKIIDTAPNPVFYKDKDGVYRGCNDSFADIVIGLPKADIIGRSLFDLPDRIPDKNANVYHQKDLELIQHPGKQFYEARVKCADNTFRDFFFSKATLTDDHGNVSGIVGVMIDISELKKTEDALRESRERFKRLLDATFGGILIHENGLIIDVNQGLSDITGYDYDELIGMHGLKLIAPEWRHHLIKKIMAQDEKLYDVEGIRKDGSKYPLEIQAKAIPFEGRVVRVTGLRDVSERRQAQEERERLITELWSTNRKLTELSVTDSLTGVSNRRHIFEKLTMELKKSNRYGDDLTILLIDIDHFKKINDTYGHPFGDSVLQKICAVFKTILREIDMIGRYGGEEFLFVLPSTNLDQGYHLAERIRHSIESMEWEHNGLQITLSGGIAQYQGESETDLLKRTDELLYQAKSSGRNIIAM